MRSPTALVHLDPAYPPLWRDGEPLQFGAESVLRVTVHSAWVERLISRLRRGIRATSFDVIAHGLGAPRDEARALLERLQPLLKEVAPPLGSVWVDAIGLADSRPEARMRLALEETGFRITPQDAADAVAVVLVQGAVAAAQLRHHLRDDTAHLPVGFEPGALTVGPLVIPGRTPCLSCRDGHERDRDAAWPLVHAQLIGDGSAPPTTAGVAEAAGLIARLLGEPALDTGRWVRVGADGRRVWRSATFHEECRCRAPSSRSPRGTATGRAASDPGTTSRTAFARPA